MRGVDLLEVIAAQGHERVIAFQHPPSGLRGFIAIHTTRLGSMGGVRLLRYRSEREALDDALRLSRAMTYKCVLAELEVGGAKAVIIDHPGLSRAAAFRAFGRFVDGLGGAFFTGPDVGVRPADLVAIRGSTRHVATESDPGLGDVSQHTAMGVWHAMRACLERVGIDPQQARVVIQGAGNVGGWLARILAGSGCLVSVADSNLARARRVARAVDGRVVAADDALAADCDVLSPCALGGVLDARTIPRIRARIVCGAANNQLHTPQDAVRLSRRGILYAPDYLANAGGLIRGAEFYLRRKGESWGTLERIHGRMSRVAKLAVKRRQSTAQVADELVEAALKRRARTS
jgi:leucine dehydrogenase